MIALFDRYAACLFLAAVLSMSGTVAVLCDWAQYRNRNKETRR